MADLARKVIRKIRHQFKPPEKPEPLWKKLKAKSEGRAYMGEIWEHDKVTVRDHNFQKAVLARETQVQEIRAEKQRQEDIAAARLDNLKKARRKLKRLRAKGNEPESP